MTVKNAVTVTPPDGGWGYFIALGLTIVLGTSMVPLQSCFSIVFGNFLSEVGDGPSSVTAIISVFSILSTFTGIFANPLIQKYPLRNISLFGAIIFMIGSFANIFVTESWHLVITYGVFQGFGFGFILPCILTSFNSYFEKRRAFMNGLAQVGICPIYIILPVCFQYFKENYGFRGTVAILAAFTANMFVAVALMSPVEKHSTTNKKEYELVTVSVNGKIMEKEHTETETGSVNEKTIENGHTETITVNKNGIEKEHFENETVSVKNEKNIDEQHTETETRLVDESTTKLLNENTALNTENNFSEKSILDNNSKSGLWEQISHMFDLTLLHEWRYVNLISGIAIFFYLDVNFLTLSPMFLINRGFNPDQVALCITTSGIGDFIGRSSLTILSNFIHFKFWYIVLAASFLMTLCRIIFLIDMSYTCMLALFLITGICRSYIHTPIPLLFTERYSIDRFPAAWGLYSVGCGFSNIFIGTVIGFVADFFKNDTYTVQTFTIMSSVWIITWVIQIFFEKRDNKH